MIDNCSFSQGLVYVKNGSYMRLPHWSDDVKIRAQIPDPKSKMTHPYFYVESDRGLVPWIPTQVEMFADNWMVYSET